MERQASHEPLRKGTASASPTRAWKRRSPQMSARLRLRSQPICGREREFRNGLVGRPESPPATAYPLPHARRREKLGGGESLSPSSRREGPPGTAGQPFPRHRSRTELGAARGNTRSRVKTTEVDTVSPHWHPVHHPPESRALGNGNHPQNTDFWSFVGAYRCLSIQTLLCWPPQQEDGCGLCPLLFTFQYI